MATYIRVLHPDGSLQMVDYQAESLTAAAAFEPRLSRAGLARD